MMNSLKLLSVASAVVATLAITGCEDPIPTDYVPEYVFTGYLIVGDPIDNITVTRSLSPLDSFEYDAAEVNDAVISIWNESDTFELRYHVADGGGPGRYAAVDTTITVQPETRYWMRAVMSDGTVLTGQTFTPAQISWTAEPRDTLQYPIDTIALPSPDSLRLKWTAAPTVDEYLISVEALDTLNYGLYLNPPTSEPNRRMVRFFETGESPRYNDVIRYGFLQNTQVNVVWFAFKWYGRQEVTIWAPDDNMIQWFKAIQWGGSNFDPLLGSIEGGIGAFASASVVRKEVFVLKNQP